MTLVSDPLAPLVVDRDLGLSAGPMVVQIGVHEVAIEGVESLCMTVVNVAIADVLAEK